MHADGPAAGAGLINDGEAGRVLFVQLLAHDLDRFHDSEATTHGLILEC